MGRTKIDNSTTDQKTMREAKKTLDNQALQNAPAAPKKRKSTRVSQPGMFDRLKKSLF